MRRPKTNLRSKDALRVKQADMWLRAGQPLNAVRDLHQLTARAWNHPWTEQIVWRAAQEIADLRAGQGTQFPAD